MALSAPDPIPERKPRPLALLGSVSSVNRVIEEAAQCSFLLMSAETVRSAN
jgi:hypothetical protein